MAFRKHFGGKATPELIERYSQSPNWRDGAFQNFEPTEVGGDIRKIPSIIYKQLTNRSARQPKRPLPVAPLDREALENGSDRIKMVWYGHSALLMNVSGINLLVDPMLGPNTTPIAPFAVRRFSENSLGWIDDFPPIDLALLSHDHYDHLDLASIEKLRSKVARWLVALGVKRHLVKWGVDPETITEFDWWDQQSLQHVKINYTPTRHFSGRGLSDRNKSLWGGWVIDNGTEKIWFSGDGGYGDHFKEVGKRLGPFDLGLMECGQYNDDWHDIHLFPDESVRAALDANVKQVMPVHWGGFALSYQHTWKEPASQFVAACQEANLDYLLPELGQVFQAGQELTAPWWEAFE